MILCIEGTMDSEVYCSVLELNLLIYANAKHPFGWTLQQDNEPIHISKDTKEWMFNNAIDVIG